MVEIGFGGQKDPILGPEQKLGLGDVSLFGFQFYQEKDWKL